MCALLFLAEAQLSMDFGRIFQYSWWIYHGLFFIAFLSILATWGFGTATGEEYLCDRRGDRDAGCPHAA